MGYAQGIQDLRIVDSIVQLQQVNKYLVSFLGIELFKAVIPEYLVNKGVEVGV